MLFNAAETLLALAPPPGGGGQQSSAPIWTSLVPILLMVFVFYFIFIRPQQKKTKEHESLMKTLRAGDKVVTGSGILGIVVSVKDTSVAIRSADSKLEVLKSAISQIVERAGDTAESKS
jgi:preprotein translocase subunit YajC